MQESSSRHSHLRKRHSRLSPSRPRRSPQRRPPSDSDSESLSEACVTAEDEFLEDEVLTSEYHSPPEEISDSEEEEKEGRVKQSGATSRERAQEKRRGKERGKGGSPKGSKPPPMVVDTTISLPEERQRSGSERHCSFSGGVLSPVQESPEYACTPSSHGSVGSADELENDLNIALSQLDSETSGLQADAQEVKRIEQTAARLSETSQSGSPSPFRAGTPITPNTVVWEKGTCVVLSSTPDPKTAEDGQERGEGEELEKKTERQEEEEEEEGGKREDEMKETVTEKLEDAKEGSTEVAAEGGEFAAIPRVEPSLGLREGHDRQQLAVARSSTRRRLPSRHSASQV